MMDEGIRISNITTSTSTSTIENSTSGRHSLINNRMVQHPQQHQHQLNGLTTEAAMVERSSESSASTTATATTNVINSLCIDPYITADSYRNCAMQQQQLEEDVSDTNENRSEILNRVYFVNDRPYIPQWRVEVVKDHISMSVENINNNINYNNNNTDDELYLSIKSIAAAIMLLQRQQPSTTETTTSNDILARNKFVAIPDTTILQKIAKHLSVERVMGGVTNTLYKVSGFRQSLSAQQEYTTGSSSSSSSMTVDDNVLVRIFGAEGLIDRDDETGVFAALSQYHLAPSYYGRFNNGRVEGYQDGMRPLECRELQSGPTSIAKGIAINLARLHYGFRILPTLSIERRKPTLWKQLYDWLDQAEAATFQFESDTEVVATLQLPTIRPELIWLQDEVEKVMDTGRNTDPIVFCHNDLLAANILYNDTTEIIQLIDFEYGGINYRAFDIANHFNEYAGGPPTEICPNYNLLPTEEQQRNFIRTYLETAAATTSLTCTSVSDFPSMNGSIHSKVHEQEVNQIVRIPDTIEESQVDAMMKEVEIFLLTNHLYWGLWGVNQASIEGCSVYDYMSYGVNRIQQYWIQRNRIG